MQRSILAILLLLSAAPGLAQDEPATQPADAPATVDEPGKPPVTKTKAQAAEPAKRETADGLELPPVVAEKRWYGEDLYMPMMKDPIGRKPEEVFGFSKAIRTLEKSEKLAKSKVNPHDVRPLTMPYFVTDKFGASYVGFNLLDGRIYQMELRYQKQWNASEWDILEKEATRQYEIRQAKDRLSPTYYGYRAENLVMGAPTSYIVRAGVHPRPLLRKLGENNPPSIRNAIQERKPQLGWKIEQVMAALNCLSRTEGSDENGKFYILARVDEDQRLVGELSTVKVAKAYVVDDKVVKIKSAGTTNFRVYDSEGNVVSASNDPKKGGKSSDE